jgi:ElaB/YqjD/DUF883 family membrane-anchored ribosome-binding protein
MMNDTSSDNVRNLEERVTEAGEAIGERVQSATAATAAAASQAKRVLGDAGEAAQQAWSQASGMAEDFVDAGRRATKSVSRQIHERPLILVLVAFAFGCVAGLWLQGGSSRPGGTRAISRLPKRLRYSG